jgi:hypothetical protein
VEIERREITVRELAEDYEDRDVEGVVAYSERLDVRPPYQREFVYKPKQRDAVIDTITRGFPLNVMYWAVRDDGNFEIIDGQQRTISVCQFVESEFAVKAFGVPEARYFHNLQADEKKRVLDYELTVYLCSGTDSEKLEWFKTINIAGEELTNQELRNAVYSGTWVTDAKRYFSKNGCAAYGLGSDYMTGTPIRQDYLETVIKWINDGDIEGYMAKKQHKPDATELWLYFQSVIAWVKATFPHHRKEMKSVPWGELYNKFKDVEYDPAKLEEQVAGLMADEDVTKKRGIYPYVLDGSERHLSIRQFTDNQKREAYERQKGICPVCQEHYELSEMQADHITPWHLGGKTIASNCKMLCADDNRKKSGV